MEESGVINVERDFANNREGVCPVLVVEDSDVLRHQSAKWTEGEAPNRNFDSPLMQFFDHAGAPFSSKSFFGQVPPTSNHRSGQKHDEKSNSADQQSAAKRL